MNGNTVKIIAVVAVIVVVASGVGVVLFMNQNKDSGYKIDAALEVYGNADGDYKIDSKDVDVIQNIIDGKEGYTLEAYPLANAYKADDVVDEKDIEQVKKIIAGGNDDGSQMTVWHINHTTDTKVANGEYVVETKWPVKKAIANGTANALMIYEMIGLKENIVGINYSSGSPPDPVIFPEYNKMPSLGTSTMYLTESKVKDCVKDNEGTTAVITADNKSYLTSACTEDYLENTLKIDVIRIEHAAVDPNDYASALLMLGFLFQKDTKAQEASEWTTIIFKELSDKLSSVDKKVRVAVSSGEKYLSARNSDYADVAVQAGGEYTIWTASSTSIYFRTYVGSKTTYDPDPKVYNPEYQADVIIGLRTGAVLGKASDGASWYGSTDLWDKQKIKDYIADFSDFQCYKEKNIYIISGDCPIVARVLYSAAVLYPDLVSMDWANEMHQEYVDKYLGGLYTVKDCHFVISMTEVENM